MVESQQFDIPEIHSFEQIYDTARKLTAGNKPRAALVVPSDVTMLKAFSQAVEAGFIDPTLIGDEELARKKAAEHKINLDKIKFIDIREPDISVATAARMASLDEIDLIIKGRIPTVGFLQIIFEKDVSFRRKGKIISHVAVIKPDLYDKLLFLTDAGVNEEPDLKCKLALIDNLVNFARSIGVTMPRVAILAAVEVVYPQMPVTMDAAIISKMAERKQIRGAYVDGPLSFDVAVDMFAAHSKGVKTSPVAGQADALLEPNIETANGIYEAMSLYGNARLGGILYGGVVPVALASRSDSVSNRLNSIVLGVLAANK